jgi:hypothetical protein
LYLYPLFPYSTLSLLTQFHHSVLGLISSPHHCILNFINLSCGTSVSDLAKHFGFGCHPFLFFMGEIFMHYPLHRKRCTDTQDTFFWEVGSVSIFM